MMTIVTHVHLKEGVGREWDAAMRTRLSAAKKRPGWVGGQLLRQSYKPDRRVIVGTWKTRADGEAGHHDRQFAATRGRLDGLESGPAEHWCNELVVDVRKSAAASAAASNPPSSTARTPERTIAAACSRLMPFTSGSACRCTSRHSDPSRR